ncbi:unnamed protein product [Paramecium pentaurelia]|uniref:Uncharacterized protein n=1 Tax=Paramecium pentaurelia TaxID=43138 RepID=A0A8S1SXL6_9CILI|nr:unnamed protein product [Paramecium pentaurelia]
MHLLCSMQIICSRISTTYKLGIKTLLLELLMINKKTQINMLFQNSKSHVSLLSYFSFIGKPFQFTGQRSADSLFQFILQVYINKIYNIFSWSMGPTEILRQDQFNRFLNDNDVVLFYQGSENNINNPSYWTFFGMSKTNCDAAFAF